jgi:serine/threonine-protein kinase
MLSVSSVASLGGYSRLEARLADRLTLPEPGDVIAGKYRIDCALGSGGMGAVFQVTHRVTGKRFALKWLLPQVSAHGDAAQRFIREAQVAGRFEHPNVVEVYDVGSEGDSFYMVMELLEGESLAERVERAGPLAVTEACELLIPCLRGVAEAHAAGIVHRDLKPANLFICQPTRQFPAFAKVLDFGISKMSGAPGGELGGGMTKSGTLIGTPHYMPLEQMRGKAVDHRADIYAFGVVMYQVLSGKLPYPADSFSDLVLMLAHETPQPLDQIVRRLPRGISQVIAKAMSRDAADRYQSVEELIAVLEPYARGDIPSVPPPRNSRRSLDASLSLPTPLSTESRKSARVPRQKPVASPGVWIAGVSAVVIVLAAGTLWLRSDRGHIETAGTSPDVPGVVRPAVAAPSEAATTDQTAKPAPGVKASAGRPVQAKAAEAEDDIPKLDIVRTEPEQVAPQQAQLPEAVHPGAAPQPGPGAGQIPQQNTNLAAARGGAPNLPASKTLMPAVTRGATPNAARASSAAAAPRGTEARVQSQRQPPPIPERSEAQVKKQPEPSKPPLEVKPRPPASSRVPAISEGDFY